MFDKIQSTYFKRVTTGVLALFMTASSGFSYAVPVYAEEVTTAAAKRKKEEEFSSTESSTLQLNENSTKEEVVENKEDKSSNTTEKTLTTKTTEVSDEKVQNESQRSDEDIQKEKQEMKSNFKVADIDYSSLKKSEYAKDKLEYDDKSLQKLFDYKIEIEQISFDDALKSVENYIANNEFDFYEFLCKISQNDPYKLFYSLSDADREKVLKQCNENEQYALKYLLMYSGLDFIQQNQKNNENKTFYVESLSKYFDNFKKFNKDNNLGEDVHDFDMLMDNFFQMRKENYRKNIVYLIESHSELINKIINILNDSSKWNKSGINEIEKICNNKFQVKQNSGILKEKAKPKPKVSYTKGGFYLAKEAGSTQRTNVTLTRDNAPAWSNFTSTAYTYNISRNNSTLIPNGWIETKNGTPVYSSNKVKARKDQETGFTVLYFRVTYTQPAHYKKDQADHDKANCDNAGRMNFFKYSAANDSTENTFMDDLVHANTDRAVNYQINMMQCGLRDDAEGSHHGHAATEGKDPSFGSTLKYKKPTHTVRYYDSVNSNPVDTRSVSDGNKASSAGVPSDPTRAGYRFIGWRNTANESPWDKTICGTENFYAKWQKQYRLDINGRLNGGSIQSNTNGMGTFDVFVNGTQIRWSDRDAWDMIDDGATVEIKNIKADSGIHYSGNSTISFTMNGDKTDGNAIILDFTSGSTLSIDPNGGTYKGSSGVTTVNRLSPGATITVDSPTRPGYKFGGYDTSHGDYQYFASNNGWTTSHGENVGTYSRSFDGNVSLNEAPDGGYYRTNHVWRGIDSATDNYNCISFPTYTAQAGHTYKISGEVWISERPSGGSFALNFYHGDSSNDWKHCMWGISEGWTGKWVKFSMERTFDTTTNDARFEIWTSNLKGLTGNISFWLQGLKITDETTGNDVSMTKIAMGNSDIKLTARWIPLHSTLSYDAQGGSLDSVKSTDNPNNYKIVDNGDYFIQSGLNSSRYLHDYDCSRENGAKVCTFQGYGANAKQCIWTFERYKNTPYYYIINKYNGKALNLSGDGPGDLSGQTVEMWTQLNAANENQSDFLWYFKDAGNGYVTICNKYTDKALDIPGGEDNDNVKLQQYTPNGTASQKFKLVATKTQVRTTIKQNGKFLSFYILKNGKNEFELSNTKEEFDIIKDASKYGYSLGGKCDNTYTTMSGISFKKQKNGKYLIKLDDYYLIKNENSDTCYWGEYDDAVESDYITYIDNALFDIEGNLPEDGKTNEFPTREKYTDSNVYINSATPVKEGCKFLGWNTKEDGSGKTYQAGNLYDVNQDGGNVTLYAQWEKAKYTATVKLNGGSYNGSTKDFTISKYPGETFSVGIPTKNKYNFSGWGLKMDQDSNLSDFPKNVTYNVGYRLSTKKHKEQTGSYVNQPDMSNSFRWRNVENNKSVNLYNTVQYSKVHLKKGHHYKLIAQYYLNSNYNNNDAKFYVRIRSNDKQKVGESDYRISATYNKAGESIFDKTATADEDVTIEVDTVIPPGTKSSTLQYGMDIQLYDVTSQCYVGGDSSGEMNTGNFTLNAQWTPWKHTVTYNANAGNDASVKGVPASQSKTANVDITLSSDVPTRNGYTFLGWNTQADGNGTAYAAGATYTHDQDGGTVTLYAKWTPWKHVLHYNKNVPTSSTSQTVSNMPVDQTKTFGQFMAISNLVPTRKGYTFAGWYTQSNGTGTKYDPGSNYAADQNGGTVNLYAKWTPWTYNIKYDQNVKSTSSSKTVTDMPNAQTKTQEIDVTLSSMTPKRNGYIFAGWSTSANGSVEYKPGSRFTKDLDSNGASITLYAVWTPWKHTIHYNSNIPTNAPTGTTTVSNMPGDQTKTFDEKLMISSNKPTRKGYNFAGWSTSANGNVVYQPGAEYKNDQNGGTVTLYAKWTAWKHTVTYDKNVPANSKKTDVKNMPGNQTKIYDQNLTLQSNVPTRIGYTFVKWTTNKDGTGTAYQPGSQYSYNRDSDGGTVTLYAVWTPWKYTVRYDKNVPANSSSQTVSNMPADQTKTEEVNLTLSSNKPSRNGYIFNGWQTQINGKAVDYQPGATLSYDPDVKGSVITLKAKWTAWKHTIHYDKNVPASSKKTNVTNMPGDQVKVFDTALSIQPMVPKRTGYTFKGWSTTANGKAEYQPGNKYNHDQNDGTVTLYAVWTPWKYKVQYDKNVSADSSSQTVSNMPTDQTKTEEVVLTLSSNKPSRNGYIFNGWQAQINGKAVDYQPGAKLSYDVDDKDGSTIILKAQWTPWKHTVHYDKNVPANSSSQTVTNMPEDQTKTFDEKLNLSTKIPKREGYNFVGWLLEYGTAIAVVSPGTAYERDQNGGTYVLKAQWEPWKHTVHYDANGGDQSSVPNDQKKTYEQNMNVATKVPTRNEYKFLGWKAYHEYNDKSGNKHSELIGNYQPGASYNYDIDETGQYAADNGEYNKCGTVTMKAQWVQLYTVKYDGNQPAIKGVTVTGSVANQTQGQDESVNLQNNNFKNNSGIFKDWSVGQDAYKYAVKSGTFRKYIHPEGYGTKHSTMTQELKDYTKDANEVDRTLVRN